MARGRWKISSRGDPLLIAWRDLVSSDESRFVLPEVVARAELDWLASEAVQILVEHFAPRFPNSQHPGITGRVMSYVRDQVSTGNIVLVRQV